MPTSRSPDSRDRARRRGRDPSDDEPLRRRRSPARGDSRKRSPAKRSPARGDSRKRSPPRRSPARGDSRKRSPPRRSPARGDSRRRSPPRRSDGGKRSRSRRRSPPRDSDNRRRSREPDNRDTRRRSPARRRSPSRGRSPPRGRRSPPRDRRSPPRDEGDRNRKRSKWDDGAPSGSGDKPPEWLSDIMGGAGGVDDEAPGSGRQPPIPTAEGLVGTMPLGGPPGRLNCKTLQIPVDAKPFLIGKGGKVINGIRGATQSYIQINNAGPGDKFCTVMITGNVEKVEEMIAETLQGWNIPSDKPTPNEKLLTELKVGAINPMTVAPPVQMSTAAIWNWNRT